MERRENKTQGKRNLVVVVHSCCGWVGVGVVQRSGEMCGGVLEVGESVGRRKSGRWWKTSLDAGE